MDSWGWLASGRGGLGGFGGRLWEQTVWGALPGCTSSASVCCGVHSNVGIGVEFFLPDQHFKNQSAVLCSSFSGNNMVCSFT